MRTIATILATCCLVQGLAAQEILWTKVGVSKRIVGIAVFIGDANGDGYDELVTSVLEGTPPRGTFLVLSGKDGSTLRTIRRPKDYSYIFPRAAGDMNGDGVADYAATRQLQASPWDPNVVEVRSGKDGRVLWQVSGPNSDGFGTELVGDLDVDGDGKPDLLVSAYQRTPPKVWAYDHQGKLIRSYDVVGFRLGRMGDLDGDGCDDFVTSCDEKRSQGAACVHSGRTGKLLVKGVGPRRGDYLGTGTVAGCGDVDGDGVLDFIASSHGGFGSNRGLAILFSGTGKVIYTWREPRIEEFAVHLATGVDLDLDGVPDLLARSPETPPGHPKSSGVVRWYSLRDGKLVTKVNPPGFPFLSFFGYDMAIGRPQPGSPFPVFAVGEQDYSVTPTSGRVGRLTLFRATPPGVRSLGRGCAGPTLDAEPRIGIRDLDGKGVRIQIANAPPGTVMPLLLGISNRRWNGAPLPLALGGFGLPGCKLYTSIEAVVFARTGTKGHDHGYAFVDIPVPLATGKPKLTVYGQWLVGATGGRPIAGVSAALSWRH